MEYFFTIDQGNILIRLLLAHVAADFIFQTKKMVEGKTWKSSYMWLHIAVVFILTFIATPIWTVALIIAALHWLTDSGKISIKAKYPDKEHLLFILDQLVHVIVLVLVWSYFFVNFGAVYNALVWPFNEYKTSLLLLGYALIIWPAGFVLKFALKNITTSTTSDNVLAGGQLIGQFERIIILTLVLLQQYDAIGFLIAGKGIIRFAERDKITSEYVLVGTMMSYAFAILIGALINWLIAFK